MIESRPDGMEAVADAINRLTRVYVMSLVATMQRGEQIRFMTAAGYTPKEIGYLLNVTPNSVSVTLLGQRKKAAAPAKKKATKSARKGS